jgi:hypothetical protein
MAFVILPILGKVLLSGAAFGAGYDMYSKGKALVKENGPIVKEGLGGMWDDLGEKAGGLLDPLDVFGFRKKKKEEDLAAASQSAKKKAEKKAKQEAIAANKAKNEEIASIRAEKNAEIDRIRKEASARIAEAEKSAKASAIKASKDSKSTVAKVREAGQRALAIARAELARINALRAADLKAKQEGEDSPLTAFVQAALMTIAEGAAPPEPQEYASYFGEEVFYEEPDMALMGAENEDNLPSWGDFV